MIQEIAVNVSFLKHTLTKKDLGIVEGDYNSTKLLFNIEENLSEQEHLRFKLSDPDGNVVLLKELTEPEIMLAGYDEDGKVYSLFAKSGVYRFELILYTDNSKLTSAPGWLVVSKRQVNVGQEGGGVYLPLLDEILLKLKDVEKIQVVDQIYNPESLNPQSGKAVAEAIQQGFEGAAKKLETINTLTTTENTKLIKIDTDTLGNSFELDEAYIIVEMPSSTIQNAYNFYLTDHTAFYINANNVKGSTTKFIFEWNREKGGTIEVHRYGYELHTKRSKMPVENMIANQFRIQTWDAEGGVPAGTKIIVKGIRK